MSRRYSTRLFRKVLVPILQGTPEETAVGAALMIADAPHIVLAGIVPIPDDQTLSAAALPARMLRETVRGLIASSGLRAIGRARVSHLPWQEVLRIVEEEHPDLLVVGEDQLPLLQITAGEALRNPPCDMILARGPIPATPAKVLFALRGGPSAELALRLGLAIRGRTEAELTALHLAPAAGTAPADAAFKGVDRVLRNLPHVRRDFVVTDDAATGIIQAAREADVLILGATAQPAGAPVSIGPVADAVLNQRSGGVLVVKSSRPMPTDMTSEVAGHAAISVLVDKWFAENTYHAAEFGDLGILLRAKAAQGLTISVALPALNEEGTVGGVISTIIRELMTRVPLVDEVVLVDSNSSDRTREIARGLGVPVHIHQQVLPGLGARPGKGEALWKSLLLTRGDILIWVDTDIGNFHPRFVYGLLGPLIIHPELKFVKGFYRRPLKVDNKLQAGGGGRVTELTARPLLNLFFPELSGIIQPLSGEYGGRRTALEQLAFSSGYGVEMGLLIDFFERFGLDAIAQVDLQERIHHNQPLESLSKMSFAIIQTVMRRLERRYGIQMLEDVNKTMKLIRYGERRLLLDVDEIAELERPPMLEIEEYRRRFGRGIPQVDPD
jgi:glucosyl-3-phosphoglycerate synthase